LALRRDNKVVAEEWERVKELFESALDCPPPQRAEFLSRLGQDDPAVARQVSDLLASHEQAGDFLHHPLIFAADFLDDLEEPQRFATDDVLCNRFKIVRLIGKGGMGEVYEAFDQELEERVALKTLRFEVSSNEIFTARFRREIQLARKVTHPNVCRIFESLRHQAGNETISVLSMELLQGQTLGDYLKSKGRLTADEALPLARQIIDGLSAVHAAGIIHRDLKPSNLVLVPEGDTFRVKITDFGIAGRLPENPSQPALTQASKLLGTPDYMAPEQLEQGRATIQSDIYSLGLVLYEMITGAKPFAGAVWKRLSHRAPNPKHVAPDVSGSWQRSILCCLAKDAAQRPATVDAVWRLIVTPPPRKWPARLLFASAIALVVLLAVLAFRPHHISPEAQSAVDVARVAIENPSKDGFMKGIEEYKRATTLEPGWAQAWAELAYAYAAASNARFIDGKTALKEARRAALQAIEIDPNLAKAQGAIAWTESLDFEEWPKAEDSFRRALRLGPDDGQIHYWFGVHLRKIGRFKEAEQHDRQALILTHQRDPNIWCELAFLYWTSDQISKLHQHLQEQLKTFPNFPLTRYMYARLLKIEHHFRQAEDELAFAKRLGFNPLTILVEQASLEEEEGKLAAALSDIAQVVSASHTSEVDGLLLAGVYAGLHKNDEAFTVLEAAYQRKDNTLLSLATSPVVRPLRPDPRFTMLLRRLHFTDQIMQQIGFN
jgi:tetratricopeptide (TPR) repeat protein/tRNA A-37 threonylcarbamoyl transferase component Bud32